jgi:prepilin-type N-terminal cleavage/methylation domain-containing protein
MKTHKQAISKNAFTLLEVLIAISIVMIAGTGIYKAFSSGLSLHKRAQAHNVYSEIALMLERLSEDLSNSYIADNIFFKGLPDKIIFYTHETRFLLVSQESQNHIDQSGLFPIHKIIYTYDASTKNFSRKEYDFGSENHSVSTVMLKDADSVQLSYKIYDEKTGEYSFHMFTDRLPESVKVEVALRDYSEKHLPNNFIVDIPLAN